MNLKKIIQYFMWEVINKILLSLKKRQEYEFDIIRYNGINIGCGIHNLPNWIGIDGGITHFLINKLPRIISKFLFSNMTMSANYCFKDYCEKIKSFKLIHHEIRFGLPFKELTVPNIYSSHFIEHLAYNDAKMLLIECYRILKKDGILRICVPDLQDQIDLIRSAISEYELGNITPIQEFVCSTHNSYKSYYSHHQFMYNYTKIEVLLKEIGFRNIKRRMKNEGNILEVDKLDTQNGLFVEACKF